MSVVRLQEWIRRENTERAPVLPAKVGEFVTEAGAKRIAQRVQAYWNARPGFEWVRCTVEKMVDIPPEALHPEDHNVRDAERTLAGGEGYQKGGAYVVRSNMAYLAGGRGPVEFTPPPPEEPLPPKKRKPSPGRPKKKLEAVPTP